MGVCDVPVISSVCDAVGEGAASLVAAPFDWLAQAMGAAAGWLFEAVWSVFDTTTLVDVTKPGYVAVYNLLFGIAVFVMLIFFCLQLITGLVRRDPTALTRAALGLAKSVLGSFVVITLTALLLEVVDQLCIGIVQAAGETTESMGDKIALLAAGLVGINIAAPGVGAIITIFMAGLAITQVSAPIDADLASVSDPIAGIVLMAMAAFAPYLTYKFIAFVGFDMYHAIGSEQDAKSALNRPIPVPSKPQGGGDPKKVLDGAGSGGNSGGGAGGGSGSSALPPPKTPVPTPAASSGGAAGGGGAAAGGSGAAAAGPVAAGVVIGASVAKGAATAGPKAGTALGAQGEHAADAAAQTPPPPATPAVAPPSSLAPRPPSADPSPPPPKQPPPPAPRPTKE